MPKPTKVRILEYLYTVSSIPRKQLKLAFQDVAYNTVFRATKELLDSGYIELLSVSKGPTRIKITKAGMDYLSKQKDAVMQANIRSTVTSSSKTINVAFYKSKNNTNYEIVPIISNPVGLDKYYVTISSKQANGFIATVYGTYTSIKVDFLVKGGIL